MDWVFVWILTWVGTFSADVQTQVVRMSEAQCKALAINSVGKNAAAEMVAYCIAPDGQRWLPEGAQATDWKTLPPPPVEKE